jgi:pimeloyl-ACP methyl ester carboxylesterase
MEDLMPQTRIQPIKDVELQYLDYTGDDPAIILQHAAGFLPWLWHPIAKGLAGTHRVLAPYFCDHREADLDKGGLHWMTLAEDMARLTAALDIAKPVLVGHSMGGTVMTLAEAAYNLGAAGLILIEPIFFPQDYYNSGTAMENHPLVNKSLRRRNQWEDAAAVKAYLRRKPLFANWDEAFLDLYIEYGTVRRKDFGLELTCPPPGEAALFMGGRQYDPWPLLPKVRCPVLVLEGADSGNRSFIDLEKAAARFPHGRFERIADAGHLLVMEKPHEVLRMIQNFTSTVV